MFRLRSHAAGGPRRHLLLGTASVVLLLASVAPAQAAPSVYVTNGDHVSVSQYGIGAGGLLAPLVPPTASAQDFPLGVAVSPNGKSVYVANEGRYDSVSQFNVAAGGTALAQESGHGARRGWAQRGRRKPGRRQRLRHKHPPDLPVQRRPSPGSSPLRTRP